MFAILFVFIFIARIDAISWSMPIDLSSTDVRSNESKTAIDPAGNVVAMWRARLEDNSFIIQAATKLTTSSWSLPVEVGQDASGGPVLGVDTSGNAVSLWEAFNGANFLIQSASKLFRQNWTLPITISTAGLDGIFPSIAVDGSGNATGGWQRFNGLSGITQAATKPFGGNWTDPEDIGLGEHIVGGTIMAVDGNGNLVSVWTRSDGTIRSATKLFGADWTAPVTISNVGGSEGPVLAVDGQGNAVAVWTKTDGMNNTIQSASKPFGQNWTAAVDISDPGVDVGGPATAIDSNGNAVAVWRGFDGINDIIQAAMKPFGQPWSAPVDLSAAGEDADWPAVGMDALGNAVTLWARSNGTNIVIQAATKQFGENWTAPVDLSLSTGANIFRPFVSVNALGYIVAVWPQFLSDSHQVIQAVTSVFLVPPPSLLITKAYNNFGVVKELFNTLRWASSPSDDLAGYKVYRNQQLIATLNPAILQYEDHNRKKGVSQIYSVTTIDTSGRESLPITQVFTD